MYILFSCPFFSVTRAHPSTPILSLFLSSFYSHPLVIHMSSLCFIQQTFSLLTHLSTLFFLLLLLTYLVKLLEIKFQQSSEHSLFSNSVVDVFTQLTQCFDVISKLETPDPEIVKRYNKRFAKTIVKVLTTYSEILKKEFPNYVNQETTVSNQITFSFPSFLFMTTVVRHKKRNNEKRMNKMAPCTWRIKYRVTRCNCIMSLLSTILAIYKLHWQLCPLDHAIHDSPKSSFVFFSTYVTQLTHLSIRISFLIFSGVYLDEQHSATTSATGKDVWVNGWRKRKYTYLKDTLAWSSWELFLFNCTFLLPI